MTNINSLLPLGGATEMADRASGATDRWLFLMALIVIGLAAVWVGKYFVKQHEALIADFKVSRDRYQSSMIEVVRTQSAVEAQIAEVVKNNTVVMKDCKSVITECIAELRDRRVELQQSEGG
jgi:hypothetical protein